MLKTWAFVNSPPTARIPFMLQVIIASCQCQHSTVSVPSVSTTPHLKKSPTRPVGAVARKSRRKHSNTLVPAQRCLPTFSQHVNDHFRPMHLQDLPNNLLSIVKTFSQVLSGTPGPFVIFLLLVDWSRLQVLHPYILRRKTYGHDIKQQ